MHEEARPSTSEVQNPSRVLTDCNSYKIKQCKGGPKQDYPSRPSTDFSKCKSDITAAGGKGKKQYPARWCKVCCKEGRKEGSQYRLRDAMSLGPDSGVPEYSAIFGNMTLNQWAVA